MRKIYGKFIAILLLGLFLITSNNAYAAEQEMVVQSEEKFYDSKESAAEYLNDKLLNREDIIRVSLAESVYADSDVGDVMEYLLYDSEGFFETYGAQCYYEYAQNGITIVIEPNYKLTKEQNDELLIKIDSVLAKLDLYGKSEYQKVKLIHDYICDNVNYDYTYTYYTSYDALIGGEAVCQGYANLFYRMCREAGLSVRTVSGIGFEQSHAWNIVKIGDYYYNIDITWDGQSEITHYHYFLKSQSDFEDHTRDKRYETDEYNNKHIMAEDSWIEFDQIQGNVNLSYDKILIDKGKVTKLDVYVESIKRNAQFFNWKSSDDSIVTVDVNGNIKGLKSGKAVITCEINEVIKCQCEVTVEEPVILNGLVKSDDGNWYYYKDNEVYVEYTGLVKYKSNWVYINKGKLDATYTGLVKYKSKWVYVVKGKLNATYTGLVKYKSNWVYVCKGKLDATYTGMAKNQYGWWYVTKGKLDLAFTGIADHAYGTWYLQNGKLDLTFSGKVIVEGKTYKIKNGKVI